MAGRWGIWEWAVLGVVQVFVSVSVTGMQVTSVQGPGLPLTCLAPSAYHRASYIVGLAIWMNLSSGITPHLSFTLSNFSTR